MKEMVAHPANLSVILSVLSTNVKDENLEKFAVPLAQPAGKTSGITVLLEVW